MAHDPLSLLDATAQSDLLRRGEVSPTELVDAALARIDRLDPALGAVVHRRDERARAEALDPPPGPFRGVPMLVKDAVCTMAGEPYHFGMRFLAERGYVAPVDTELVRRFRQAGFVIVGRTKTPELACSAVTEPMIQGPARNPWDLGRSPGGSSGGSGAAVASGMVAVAHGNDMGGSIRIPAALCGLVGLKPTRGRTTLAPRYEIWGPLSHEHVLTRSVRDTAAVLDAVCGPFPGDLTTAPPPTGSYAAEVGADPGRLRIGVCVTAAGNAPVDPAWCEAARAAGRLLESLGHHVEEVDGALDGTGLETGMGAVIAAGLARECHLLGLAVGQPVPLEELEPMNASLVARGRAMSALELQEAVELLADQSRALTRLWVDRVDVLVTPTSAAPAPVVDELGPLAPPERLFPGLGDLTRFTAPWNVTGQPAISLPLGTDALGMPVGVQLVGAFGRDDLIIRLAAQLEAAAPWADRRPPTHA